TASDEAFCVLSFASAAPEASSEPTAAAIMAPFIISLTIGPSPWDAVSRFPQRGGDGPHQRLHSSLSRGSYVTDRIASRARARLSADRRRAAALLLRPRRAEARNCSYATCVRGTGRIPARLPCLS